MNSESEIGASLETARANGC